MKSIKGPAIFLAQFAGDKAPFNSFDAICAWASSLGYKGVQIPTWDARLFDLKKASDSKTYCDEITGTVVRMETTNGNIDLMLYDTVKPLTVTNFLGYVNRGDYAGTKKFLATYGKPSQSLRDAIRRLSAVPVDIRPLYAADK